MDNPEPPSTVTERSWEQEEIPDWLGADASVSMGYGRDGRPGLVQGLALSTLIFTAGFVIGAVTGGLVCQFFSARRSK